MKSNISVCGYDCNNCIVCKATLNNDIEIIKKAFKQNDANINKCKGCLSDVVCKACRDCYIKKCATNKGISYCSDCINFPCEYINTNLSKESIARLKEQKMSKLFNRVAVIGMCGNSCFYDVRDEKSTLVHEEVGGKGYNQAVAILRFGTKVSFLAAIGNDKNGDLCEDYMKNEGADCYFIRKEKPTLEANIYVDEFGNNTVKYSQDNVAKLTKEDVISFEEQIKNSDILLLQYEYDQEVISEAISIAKKYNVMVVVNPAPMIYSDINLIKNADIITPNELEANTLFNNNGKYSFNDLIKKEQKSPFKMVINTLGERGVCLVDKENIKEYKPIKINAVDTTGAGDTFNGVMVASICQGLSIDEAIKNGVIASGLSVTKKYVMDAIPTKSIIEEYKKEN